MTMSTKGATDGAITAVDPQSPAAAAGFKVGDAITAINAKPVEPTPGMIAAKGVFGQRGDTLHLTLKRAGSQVDVGLVRAAQNAPAGPTTSGFMISVKDMIDWQNQFAPCIGPARLPRPRSNSATGISSRSDLSRLPNWLDRIPD